MSQQPTYEELLQENLQLIGQVTILEKSFAALKDLSDSDPYPVLQFSKNGQVLMYSNKAGQDIIEYLDNPNNLKKKQAWYDRIRETFASGKKATIELDKGSDVFRGKLILIPNTKLNYVSVYAADISAIKRARQSALANEDKYRSILGAMEFGLVELNEKGIIQRAYPYFCQALGYNPEELIGQNANRILMPLEWANYMREKRILRSMGQAEVLEVQMKKKNGELVWMMVSSTSIYNQNNQAMGTLEVHLDITERKTFQEELRTAKQKAEASNFAKEKFLANMSHEIRTPLNAINGLTELLFDLRPSKAQKDYLSAIKTSSDNLLVIINDILDYSKIETGNLSLEKVGFDLKKTISSQMQAFKLKALENSVDLRLVEDDRVSDVLIGDSVRIGQVITNLLSNAIKFTPNGTVALAYELLESNKESNLIEFQVIDNGVGINPENLQEIFESFKQEDDSISRKFGGTGLGLAITQQLVELHDSKLKVESQKGLGSTFSFKVRFNIGVRADLPIDGRINRGNLAFQNLTILLAEDHEINQIVARNLLEKFGASVEVAENGREVLKMLMKKRYDVVLMDMQMPKMNGLTATRSIRNKMGLMGLNIPIVAVTANVHPTERQKCMDAGMNGYVTKPYDPEEIIHAIAKVVNPRKIKRKALKNVEKNLKENTAASSTAQGKLYDLTNLKKLSGGNDDFVRKMVLLFLDKIPKNIAKLELSLEQKDYKNLGNVAHMIRPTITSLRIDTASQALRSIENYAKNLTSLELLPKLMITVKTDLKLVINQMRQELEAEPVNE